MLACDKTITLVHHVKDDEDTYICTVITDASFFKKTTIATSKDGATPSNTYECRVINNRSIEPALGDYVVLGEVKEVKSPSDLKEYDKFRITAIGDNRRGYLPHWRLSGQ